MPLQTEAERSPIQITESVCQWNAISKWDETTRTLSNVALTSEVSKNGYRYTEQALKDAVPLYSSKRVFIDHSRPDQTKARSVRDLAGTIQNPRFEGGRIRGDIKVLDTEAGRTFLALAQSAGEGAGMSHVVIATPGADQDVMEKINDVISVDAVSFPATSATFAENMGSKQEASAKTESLPKPQSTTRHETQSVNITDEYAIAAIKGS